MPKSVVSQWCEPSLHACLVGRAAGLAVGLRVGLAVGLAVGLRVGDGVGAAVVGAAVHWSGQVPSTPSP